MTLFFFSFYCCYQNSIFKRSECFYRNKLDCCNTSIDVKVVCKVKKDKKSGSYDSKMYLKLNCMASDF